MMQHYLRIFSILMLLSLTVFATGKEYKGEAANQQIAGTELIWLKDGLKVPTYIRFEEKSRIPVVSAIDWMKQELELAEGISFVVVKEELDMLGYTHIKLQQMYNDRPVEFAVYTLHVLNGMLVSLSGDIHKTIGAPSGQYIGETNALNLAKSHIGAVTYKWEIPGEEEHLKLITGDPTSTYIPKGKLTILPKNGQLKNAEMRYGYKFKIYAHKPESHRDIYIDALDGSVLFEQNLIHTIDTAGRAHTAFSDTVDIITDTFNGAFRLNESGRGSGIHTWNMETRTQLNSAVEFTDSDNFWDNFNPQKDQYATDAHWGAEMTYDYMLTRFNRNSIDNNGYRLNSYVHFDLNWSNASWNGFSMRYGDGTATSKPFTTLDIAGHEIGHGLTQQTASLIYQNESGALNESFSDILGASIEFFVKGNGANWLIGEDRGNPLRNMSNPNMFGDPDTYLGNSWYIGALDNGGVHINSGVQNFWFYLLTEGGTGTNDHDSAYNVTAIGIEDASLIAYRNLSVYLSTFSQYEDASFFAEQSAIDIFGKCSQQHESTVNAWFAVGLGKRFYNGVKSDFMPEISSSCQLPFLARFVNLSQNGSTYEWKFGDGETSTEESPSNLYSEEGTYSVTLIVDGEDCGTDSIVLKDVIDISAIDAPNVDDDTIIICQGESTTLTASSNSSHVFWYDSELATLPLDSGQQFVTGPLSSSRNYFVRSAESYATGKVGPEDNTFGDGGFSNSNFTQIFDVFAPVELVSVLVYTGSNKDRVIQLHDENDSLLYSKPLFIEQGEQRIALNFKIPPGKNYELGFEHNTAPHCYRAEENAEYPYILPGVLAITGTTAPPQQFYYYFYDWEVRQQDCLSKESIIHASINCSIPQNAHDNLSIFPNPSVNGFNVKAFFTGEDFLKVKMFNTNGQLIRDFERKYLLEGENVIAFPTDNIAPGVYYLTLESSTLDLTEKVVIAVH